MPSKSDTPLRRIETSPCMGSPNNPTYTDGKPINGFDTETADGHIFAVSYAFHDRDPAVIENDKKAVDSEDLWAILTHSAARSAMNVWYNLNFDANVLLSHVLTRREMAEVAVTGHTETQDGYTIDFIPAKFLKISDPHNHTYQHFDVSQFFYAPLDDAADEWLGRNKVEGVDTSKFGADTDSDPVRVNDYIDQHYDEILEYAQIDAELVKELWETAVNTGETLDYQIPMGAPYSTGYLAEQFLNEHLNDKPGMGPTSMASHAWKAYAGGRFEVYERGDVGRVAGPDINSAYPWVLSELPDPATLQWRKVGRPSLEQLRDADYGFVQATVTTDDSRNIQPFVQKMDDIVKYPAFDGAQVNTLIDIFVFAADNGYIEDMSIEMAWIGTETTDTEYPFDFVSDVYDERKTFEANGQPKAGQLLKVILNSMYGKTCQTTPKRHRLDPDGEELDRYDTFVNPASIPPGLRENYENGIVERLEAGRWFNPFLAAYITGRTRLELHRRTVEYGLEDSCVMLATDCAMYHADAFENSGFRDDLVAPGLGNWDFDYEGDAFVVGAGVYEVDTDDGVKTKTRGFREADLTQAGGLRETAVQCGDDAITVEQNRPTTAAEAIWAGAPLSDVGKFVSHDRELRANFDSKRDWPPCGSYSDLLGTVQGSEPLIYEGA